MARAYLNETVVAKSDATVVVNHYFPTYSCGRLLQAVHVTGVDERSVERRVLFS